VLLPA